MKIYFKNNDIFHEYIVQLWIIHFDYEEVLAYVCVVFDSFSKTWIIQNTFEYNLFVLIKSFN